MATSRACLGFDASQSGWVTAGIAASTASVWKPQVAHEVDPRLDRAEVDVMAAGLELQEQRRHREEVPDRGRGVRENGCHHWPFGGAARLTEGVVRGSSSSTRAVADLALAEAGVAAEQLPRVDVADGDELGEAASSVGAAKWGEIGSEHPGAPVAVSDAALGGHRGELGNRVLLREQPQHQTADILVVRHQVVDGALDVADGRRVAVGEDLGAATVGRGGGEALLVAEAPDDGLHGDAGPVGDVAEGRRGRTGVRRRARPSRRGSARRSPRSSARARS